MFDYLLFADLLGGFLGNTAVVVTAVVLGLAVGIAVIFSKFLRKVEQGTALVRNGIGGSRVSFTHSLVWPVIHRVEYIDISVKRIEIKRHGDQGLICKDNLRADIEVAFFVRVNNRPDDVLQVAQAIGCERASEQDKIIELFDAKFSEALKTVGKQFDFVELYNSRDKFKDEMLSVIGTDLNGYALEDAAIDYLEQTPLESLNPDNILDSEGIKKITDLTAQQQVLANDIQREKEKTITKQNVEAREAILELERQQAEAEEKQKREVANVKAREDAETAKVHQEQRLKSEQARIATEEEVQVAEENKNRQIIVAAKNRERTNAVETERVEKDRLLEVTERERIVSLATIEKDKAIEVEKKNIQDVIRDRVIVERAVVEEQERIKDTQAFAQADRDKQVLVTQAEMSAQENLVKEVQAAEASKQSAERLAQQRLVEAEAERAAAEKETAARKMQAEAQTAEAAAKGLAEAQVTEAKATALEKEGTAQANVLERKATAEATGIEAKGTADAKRIEATGTAEGRSIEAKGVAEAAEISAKAEANEKQGTAEATVMQLKYQAEADGIEQKANSMKVLNDVGRDHEEFKIRLNKDRDVELAAINIRGEVAARQAEVMGAALESANIDIVGGETEFFDKIIHAISEGKRVDRFMTNSEVAMDIKDTFFNGDGEYFQTQLQQFIDRFGLESDDVKNLSVAALIGKMIGLSSEQGLTQELKQLLGIFERTGQAGQRVSALGLAVPAGNKKG